MSPVRRARRPHRLSGFTLLEIMLVVTIIALLLSAGIYSFRGQIGFARDVRVDADLKGLKQQLDLYYAENGFYPTTEQGLEALVTMPQTEPRPRRWRKLADAVPEDPWKQKYEYASPGQRNSDSFDLFSKGPDLKPGTPDDIGNWTVEQK